MNKINKICFGTFILIIYLIAVSYYAEDRIYPYISGGIPSTPPPEVTHQILLLFAVPTSTWAIYCFLKFYEMRIRKKFDNMEEISK